LAEAKRRGKILGANRRNLAAKNSGAADEFAALLRAKLDADLMGRSYSEIARHLNDAGITTVTGAEISSADGQELPDPAARVFR
jgi:hypothetical protein